MPEITVVLSIEQAQELLAWLLESQDAYLSGTAIAEAKNQIQYQLPDEPVKNSAPNKRGI